MALYYRYVCKSICNLWCLNSIAYKKIRADTLEHEEQDARAVELSPTIDDRNQNKKRGMVLPFEPHCITFDNIKYSVVMPQVTCYLLFDADV